MRAAPITALLLVYFLSIPARSLAIFEVRARYEFNGAVIAASLPSNDSKQFTGQHTTVSVSAEPLAMASESKSIVLAADSRVYNGFASLAGQIEAQGGVGILRARLDFDFQAENRVVLGTDILNVATVVLNSARATASWRDTTITTQPDLPDGSPLLVTEILHVNGVLVSSANGDGCCARARTGVTIRDAAGNLIYTGNTDRNLPPSDTDQLSDVLEGPPLVFIRLVQNRVPYDIGFTIDLAGRVEADRSSAARTAVGEVHGKIIANYFETLTWGGIISVVNAVTGEPVDNWTIKSESGFDYSRPYQIPEPSSIFLLASGLGWLSSARVVRCRVKSLNERNPCRSPRRPSESCRGL